MLGLSVVSPCCSVGQVWSVVILFPNILFFLRVLHTLKRQGTYSDYLWKGILPRSCPLSCTGGLASHCDRRADRTTSEEGVCTWAECHDCRTMIAFLLKFLPELPSRWTMTCKLRKTLPSPKWLGSGSFIPATGRNEEA